MRRCIRGDIYVAFVPPHEIRPGCIPHSFRPLSCGLGIAAFAAFWRRFAETAVGLFPYRQFGVVEILAATDDDRSCEIRFALNPPPRHSRDVRIAGIEQDEAAV